MLALLKKSENYGSKEWDMCEPSQYRAAILPA